MVSKYKRKSQQQSWDTVAMQGAIDAVKNGMPWQTAATTYNVPRNTLKRRVLNKNTDATGTTKVMGHYRAVFSEEQEQELVNHLLHLEVRFFGITVADLRKLAYELAERNGIPNTFNHENKMAGKDWVTGFRKRHPEIALRKPELTSAARAQAFNITNVTRFFDILEDVQKSHLYPPHRVYNVDETGLLTVQSKSSKVFAFKGRRQVGSLSSAERGVLSTFVVCMSAGGSYIPPFVIFPRERMKQELQDGAPPGTGFACHSSGWMQSDIFTQWFNHFLKYAKPSEDDPVLLILDGHATHTKNLDFIEKARSSHTTVVCLPPHCSHKLQPLDVAFMGPFNTYYVQSIERFLRNNPGRVVTQYQVSRLLGEAFLKAAMPAIAINGFKKCGIVPLNRDVFTESDFVAAETTEISVVPLDTCPPAQEQQELLQAESQELSSLPRPTTRRPTTLHSTSHGNPQPSTSFPTSPGNPQPSTSFAVSPKEILPIPKANIVKRQSKRKRGSAAVLTSSPYKRDLQTAKEEKEDKEKRQNMKDKVKSGQNQKKKQKQGAVKGKQKFVGLQEKSVSALEDSSDSDVSDVDCVYCGEPFSKSRENEGWIRCSACLLWAHDACAGCDEEDDKYTCDICRK